VQRYKPENHDFFFLPSFSFFIFFHFSFFLHWNGNPAAIAGDYPEHLIGSCHHQHWLGCQRTSRVMGIFDLFFSPILKILFALETHWMPTPPALR